MVTASPPTRPKPTKTSGNAATPPPATITQAPDVRLLALTSLETHPEQADYFAELPEADNARLRDAIQRDGQRDAILVVPLTANGDTITRYRILDGHRRVAALRALGETHVRAIVRDDLDAAAARDLFLDANSNRRQLSPMAVARIEVEKARIERDKAQRERTPFDFRAACLERISKAMKCSEKSAIRYWDIVTGTPMEVQNAVELGIMKLEVAPRFAWVSDEEKDKLAAALRGVDTVEGVAAVVTRHMPASRRRGSSASPGGRLCRAALRAVEALRPDGSVKDYDAAPHVKALEAAAMVLTQLAARGRDALAKQDAAMKELLEGLNAELANLDATPDVPEAHADNELAGVFDLADEDPNAAETDAR